MNVSFKVLWFEDQVTWRGSAERKLKKIIEAHSLVPEIVWKKGDESDAAEELNKDYDLILMDYELRGTTGDVLIKKLRQSDIYTDVLFYSGDFNKMVGTLYQVDDKDVYYIDPLDGVYFSDRKDEELYYKLQKVVDKIVRRAQDVVNLRGVVLDNVSGFENQMQNILTLAINKFSDVQLNKLNAYAKKKLVIPAKENYADKIQKIENDAQTLKAIVEAPDYLLDSYKKARLIGHIIDILVNAYGMHIESKYQNFAEAYNNEIIKYRNALSHAMRSNSNNREVFIGEIDKQPVTFNEELFRQLRASINEYQKVINMVEGTLTDI